VVPIYVAVVWQDDVSTFADEQAFATRVFPCAFVPSSKFGVQDPWVNDHAITQDQMAFLSGDTGGQKVEFEHLFAQHNSMTCIVSTLETRNPGGLFCEPVNQFPFAFIAPLGTQNHRCWHLASSVHCRKRPSLNPMPINLE
jgi:hypothetical protein